MTFRLSLRNKLIYTFLAGSLLTVALFGVVIKGIMNDYFQRLAEARHDFVTDKGQREVRTNVAIYKEAFHNIFDGINTTGAALAETGAIGDHLPQTPAERHKLADMLQRVERQMGFSMLTVVDLEGRVVLRANNPENYDDDTLMRDYGSPKPVSSVRRLLLNALTGKTIDSFEAFAPEILAKENLADQAKVQLKSNDRRAPPNTFEDRGLVMTVAMPLRTSAGRIAGAVLAGRLLNNDQTIVTDIRALLGDSA